jgi:4-hydroxy-tetrahydrodipicolinate synthase
MRGIFTALVTPFQEKGFGIHEKVFRKLIERQIEAKVQGLVIAGSTGEGPSLTENEWIQALQMASQYSSQIHIMASVGHSSTWLTAERAQLAISLGAQSLLISSPAYNKPTPWGLVEHFREVAQRVPQTPIMVYNIPGRTGVNISSETLQKIWEIENIVALKESSGNWSQYLQMQKQLPPGKAIFSGDDPLNLAFFLHGAHGSVSVLSNLLPQKLVSLWELAQAKDWKSAEIEFFKLLPLTEALFLESNPIPVKWALSQILGQDMNPRLPLTRLSAPHEKILAALLRDLFKL